MIELIKEPWPWYIAGPLIALMMFLLLFFGKNFGLSSNLRTMCSIGGAGRFSEFFRFDWKSQIWNLILLSGVVLGGFIASEYMSSAAPMDLNSDIIIELLVIPKLSFAVYFVRIKVIRYDCNPGKPSVFLKLTEHFWIFGFCPEPREFEVF